MSAEKPVIILTGGGTGGHITPILAVAEELKAINPNVTTIYIGEKGGKFDELTQDHPAIDQTFTISAGKLRRYYNESWVTRLMDIKTNALNARDSVRFLRGIAEARRILRQIKPDIVFQKGGFVGVPVSVAASRLKIPIVTHDSDTLPGLANRMVGRWAVLHATGYPAEFYKYPEDKTLHVGVLVSKAFKPVTPEIMREAKLKLTLDPDAPVLLITGASSGAEAINKAVVHSIATLLQNHSTLQIIHQTGKGKSGVYGDFKNDRLTVLEFLNPMADYMAAADIVVARASGNTLAELGVMGKACIVVPAPHLTGGHQLINARMFEEQGAVVVVEENALYDSQHGLFAAITQLLIDPKKCKQLAQTLHKQTIPDAAHRLAVALLAQIKPEPTHETTQTEV